LLEELES